MDDKDNDGGSGVIVTPMGMGGEDVSISIVKFIQSTYKGPQYKNLGMVQILRQEQQKRDPEAVVESARQKLHTKHLQFLNQYIEVDR